jgi:hypothetical protein
MDRETARPKMIASRSCHRPKISPELIPKPNHGPNQPIKRKDNHRGWCVPQRTTVVVPWRTRIVAPQRIKELTNRLESIIQTKPIPEPKPSNTILI